ncbi:MAG: hypothetical protein ACRENG_24640, partial [bacterium]
FRADAVTGDQRHRLNSILFGHVALNDSLITPILHCRVKTTTQWVLAIKGIPIFLIKNSNKESGRGFDFYMCKTKV